jgi:hypothetical protein
MRNIKIKLAIVSSILIIWLVSSISVAEQRMITFEMGESDQTVSFPMTQKEMIEAERVDKVIEGINQRKRSRKNPWIKSYELTESGIVINFPMSDEEIIKEKGKYRDFVNNRKKMAELQEEMVKQYKIFEMGESGLVIRSLKTTP